MCYLSRHELRERVSSGIDGDVHVRWEGETYLGRRPPPTVVYFL